MSSSDVYVNEVPPQNDEEALKKEIDDYRRNRSQSEDDDDVEVGEVQQIPAPVENLSCTIGSVIVFLILGAIWGSACKYNDEIIQS